MTTGSSKWNGKIPVYNYTAYSNGLYLMSATLGGSFYASQIIKIGSNPFPIMALNNYTYRRTGYLGWVFVDNNGKVTIELLPNNKIGSPPSLDTTSEATVSFYELKPIKK